MDFRNKIFQGDCYEELKKLPESCVDMVVTSPPYWQLRDYKVPPTKWPECELRIMYGFPPIKVPAMEACLGLEADPLHYIAHMVLVFEEVRRVLKPWGTCWINIGDGYATDIQTTNKVFHNPDFNKSRPSRSDTSTPKKKVPLGLKNKDMIGVPWMLAFALRTHGWYLRSDVIWHKENAMPESTRDRPTKAHEYFFLLSKSKKYYYDADAIREPHKPESVARALRGRSSTHKNAEGAPGQPPHTMLKGNENINRHRPNLAGRRSLLEALDAGQALHTIGSNKRTVWTLPTVGFKGKHYATFPEKLILPTILAGTSHHGNCASCGKPYYRIAERTIVPTEGAPKTFVVDQRDKEADENDQGSNRIKDGHKSGHVTQVKTIGWGKPCKCDTNAVVRPLVLDPFMGAGTTSLVSQSNGRDFLGYELSEESVSLSKERRTQVMGMFAQ